MMRKVQLSDEEKQYQTKCAQEKELRTLLREYLVLDKACKHSQFSRSSTEKSDNVIYIAQKEHANILKNLQRAAAPGRIKDDERQFEKLQNLLDENSMFDKNIKSYREYLKELDDEMKSLKKQVHILETQQVTDRQFEERVKYARQTCETLDNKLENQMKMFGTICYKNSILRDEINSLLSQRNLFMKQWNQLIDRISEGKKIMLDLIEQASLAYGQREEWCKKLQSLRTKACQDYTHNVNEMRENRMNYDNNLKLREFFRIKSQKRLMLDLEIKEHEKRTIMENKLTEKLRHHEAILTSIKDFTKQDNMKKLAIAITKQEEINLSNFKYVIEMIRECEEVNDRLGHLHLDIDEKNALHQSRSQQQQEKIQDLELKLEENQKETQKFKQLHESTQQFLNKLLEGVTSLFTLCKCNKDPLLALLGQNNKVTQHNVGLYLEILENTIHQYLISAYYKDKQKKSGSKPVIKATPDPKIYEIEKIVKTTPCSLCVEHEMVSDVIDVLQRSWSKPEASTKLEYRLNLPGGTARLHNISHCQLPKARQIIQRRYE